MRRSLFTAFGLLAATSSAASGQATVVGRVVNDSSGAAIEGAEIVVAQLSKALRSDAEGWFTVTGIPLGATNIVVRKIGFRPVRLRALVFGDDTLDVEVELRPTVMELPPIEVTAAAVPPGMQSYAEHRLAGFGSFIDSKELRASEHRQLSDLLRGVRGVRVVPAGAMKTIATSRRGRCPMAVWVDGLRIFQPGSGPTLDLDQFPVSNLEAVEVYSGAADTPGDLSGTGSGCGTIVLWTRRD